MSFIATIQITGDTSKDIADELRLIAEQIEEQGTMESVDPECMVHVRKQGSEEQLDGGKCWMVGQSETHPSAYVAIFADKTHAERFAADEGKHVIDLADELPMRDLCVTRARVVGTFWNSYDPDPEDEQQPKETP